MDARRPCPSSGQGARARARGVGTLTEIRAPGPRPAPGAFGRNMRPGGGNSRTTIVTTMLLLYAARAADAPTARDDGHARASAALLLDESFGQRRDLEHVSQNFTHGLQHALCFDDCTDCLLLRDQAPLADWTCHPMNAWVVGNASCGPRSGGGILLNSASSDSGRQNRQSINSYVELGAAPLGGTMSIMMWVRQTHRAPRAVSDQRPPAVRSAS